MLSFLIFILFSVPSILMVAMGSGTLAPGLVVSSIIVMGYAFLNKRVCFFKRELLFLFFICFTLFLSASISFLLFNEIKPFYSAILLSIVIFSALVFSKLIFSYSIEYLSNSIFAVLCVFLLLGWIKFLYVPTFLGYTGAKSVFPFSEESHFALSFGFLSLIYVFLGEKKRSVFLFLNSIILSIFYPSLTLLVFSILMLFALFPKYTNSFFSKLLALFVVLSLIFYVYFFYVLSSDYFSDRLLFSGTDNLTTLVFFQGLDMMTLNFSANSFLGLGFQMMGQNELTKMSDISWQIAFLNNGSYLNIEDGSFLMSKFVSEFGVLGILITFFYFLFVIRFFYKYSLRNHNYVGYWLLLNAVLFAFLVEYFLRGYGYFSPSLFIVIVVLFRLLVTSNSSRAIE